MTTPVLSARPEYPKHLAIKMLTINVCEAGVMEDDAFVP